MKFLVGMLTFLMFWGMCCAGGAMAREKVVFKTIEDVTPQKWASLAQKKIFFGHQSVGIDLMNGIVDVMAENPQISLNILDEAPGGELASGVFFHARVGKNRQPETKVAAFINVIDRQMKGKLDAAFLKFCYVDAKNDTDVIGLLGKYQEAVRNLHVKYPDLKIIHFTMPLKMQQMTWKTKVKSWLGRDVWEVADNVKRNEFNKLLLTEYRGKEPVFDIAAYEAISVDGAEETFKNKGVKYYSLRKEYTDDGGHLNSFGRKIVAEQLLIFLAENL